MQERNIGFVFQHYALFKHLPVFDNIAFGLKIKKWNRGDIERRVHDLLALMSLQGLGIRYPHQLSGGQRQRVAIARALAPKPSNACAGRAVRRRGCRIRQELREWLIRLHTDLNVTNLFVTHDQEEAMEVSGQIIETDSREGHLEQAGTPAEVYEEPATEFVARFIGSMNILEGTVRKEQVQVGAAGTPAPGFTDGLALRVGFGRTMSRLRRTRRTL
ncbi:MAG: ATP-binding cassette domain-containing protein [Nitrospiraceae bacterium]